MRIAQVASLNERIPPKKYGGTERVVHALTEELVKRGHEVTLFASGDSKTSAKLVSVFPRSLREARFDNTYTAFSLNLLNIGAAYTHQDEFDIIHDHNGELSLTPATLTTTPVVFTLHGAFTTFSKRVFTSLNKPALIGISQAQLKPAPKVNAIRVIHHGLPMKDYPFSGTPEKFLLFVGRISAEKGVHYAIEVAQNLNMPLIIAAKLDRVDLPYFNEYVGPKLNDDLIQWIGEVDEEKRNELMSKAYCFLHPVVFREPFGLTLIEAMACGCPVVAFSRGSIPEIIKDGETGFVVDDVEEMIDAVERIEEIDRYYCRRYALKEFSVERMTDEYEEVYNQLIAKSKKYSTKVSSVLKA